MNNRMMRLSDINITTGMSCTMIYRYISKHLWTKPVKLGTRNIGWPEREVEILMAARIAGQTDKQIKQLVKQLESERQQLFMTLISNNVQVET